MLKASELREKEIEAKKLLQSFEFKENRKNVEKLKEKQLSEKYFELDLLLVEYLIAKRHFLISAGKPLDSNIIIRVRTPFNEYGEMVEKSCIGDQLILFKDSYTFNKILNYSFKGRSNFEIIEKILLDNGFSVKIGNDAHGDYLFISWEY